MFKIKIRDSANGSYKLQTIAFDVSGNRTAAEISVIISN